MFIAALAVTLLPMAVFAQQPTPQQQSAIRASCRGDFQANCAGVPTGGAEALQCLKQNVAKVSPPCQQALAAVGGGPAAPVSGGMAPAPAPAAPAMPQAAPPSGGQGMPMAGGGNPPTMREELTLTREMCGPEFRAYCQNVPLGGGGAMKCLEANAASLSPGCKRALMEMRQRM